ncbi:hypothetical protein THAOC_21204 [Thalassiosira oceanica]|uniref:RING-type domain-containing protein n=1 Tax=Thalassiosira oceanica TaxID=159749 RepID=K0S1K6_THAOC|nr:hypothetical protein THAOC_21204 [Thalassiosira oceanica]|eukprot:EJK58654.1 hypothetical protein THAOC_21204 [Thalassiosira oceanica]
MGHPAEIFSPTPPDGCRCAVCMDVLESARMFPCGHTFCGGCCSGVTAASGAVCPTCRAGAGGSAPNYSVRDVVDGLTVRCPESEGHGEGRKRKRDTEAEGVAAAGGGCAWTGPLRDLDEHRKTCGYVIVPCMVPGCGHRCRRKDMEAHLSGGASLLRHMQLMHASHDARQGEAIQALTTKYESRIKSLVKSNAKYDSRIKASEEANKKYDSMMKSLEEASTIKAIHEKCLKECRRWIDYRPDALHGVKIYPIRAKIADKLRSKLCGHEHMMSGFECHIPGPSNTPWEGATLRARISYNDGAGPPRCQFEPPLFHMNVYPSGTICISTIHQDWDPNMTLHEILFTIQQNLAHPIIDDPCQSETYNVYMRGKDEYEARIKKDVAEKWSNVRPPGDNTLDVIEKADALSRAHLMEQPKVPGFARDADGKPSKENYHTSYRDCECSCCAWGQKFYDDKGKMRFLFGR